MFQGICKLTHLTLNYKKLKRVDKSTAEAAILGGRNVETKIKMPMGEPRGLEF